MALPGWCCACAGSVGRCGPLVTWPGLGTHSSGPPSPRQEPERTDSAHRLKIETDAADTRSLVCCDATRGARPHLYEGVNVFHQSLSSAYDELVDAGDGMRPAEQDSVRVHATDFQETPTCMLIIGWHMQSNKVHINRPAANLFGHTFKLRQRPPARLRQAFINDVWLPSSGRNVYHLLQHDRL